MRRLIRPRRHAWRRISLRDTLARLRLLVRRRREDPDTALCAAYEARAEEERNAECGRGTDWPDGPVSSHGTPW